MQWKEIEIFQLLLYLIDPWQLTHTCTQYRIDCISCINDSCTVGPFLKQELQNVLMILNILNIIT